jgi:3D (Asp-Asp-Asp) domain-containing protein
MNQSPYYKKLASGVSSVVVLVSVMGCAYTFGKRIRTVEAFGGPVASNVSADEPADTNASSSTNSSQPAETEISEAALGDRVLASDADLLEFNATAYCLGGPTAAGIAAHRGTIAADPRVLPLGSIVHIRAGEYSGTYLVLDTGARIKGRKIDIYMPDRREAISFGCRPVRLKVLGRVHPRHLQPK